MKGANVEFMRLPSNSEGLLNELVQAKNPARLLCERFEKASQKEDDELRGIIRELCTEGYIDVTWADNVPYFVTLNNSARTYQERIVEYESGQPKQDASMEQKSRSRIFISHRSTDKAIADMLVDFFCGTGIPRDAVFCSSLPGNDIEEKISDEVKDALKNSAINIAILSRDYYQSAFCLNEAGVLWFQDDIRAVPIALPEITSKNMYGFLNDEYKLRRLDCNTDISYIYDVVSEAVTAQQVKASVITYETQKLKERYDTFVKSREVPPDIQASAHMPVPVSDITTDDERIVLYYILKKNVRKVSKAAVLDWLCKNEIFEVNVDNAFDLLSTLDGGTIVNDTLELGIETFRYYSSNAAEVLPELSSCVDGHVKLAAKTFSSLWASGSLDSKTKLFVAYIVDKKSSSFGARWMAEGQIESNKQWEIENSLESELSSNYDNCLDFFVKYDLVYESSWTSYGNPREYTLYPSLQSLLFNRTGEISEAVQKIKDAHRVETPFD